MDRSGRGGLVFGADDSALPGSVAGIVADARQTAGSKDPARQCRDAEAGVNSFRTILHITRVEAVECDRLIFRNTGTMEPHSIVVVSLHTPKEKIWGELLAINTAGITLRGIDLNSFDHFIRQINEPDTERIGVPTLFFPMTRIERITLDEPSGSIPSMDELFNRKIGRGLIDYLAQFA
jgi:hypothetical protein